MISGFAAITIGNDKRTEDVHLESYFYNIPAAMFTAFRCFTGHNWMNFFLSDGFLCQENAPTRMVSPYTKFLRVNLGFPSSCRMSRLICWFPGLLVLLRPICLHEIQQFGECKVIEIGSYSHPIVTFKSQIVGLFPKVFLKIQGYHGHLQRDPGGAFQDCWSHRCWILPD